MTDPIHLGSVADEKGSGRRICSRLVPFDELGEREHHGTRSRFSG